MITARQLIAETRALVGVPWVHEGRTQLGVDCIGLVVLAAKNAGLDVFAAAGIAPVRRYARAASPELYSLVSARCERVASPDPGCLILFRFPPERYARHFAVLTDTGTMVHADGKARMMVVEHGYRSLWIKRTDSVWRIPGVTYE